VERTAVSGRLSWRLATVVSKTVETAQTTTIVLDPPDWPGHLAGQHVDLRLTDEDGYQAERSYSIASAPEDDHLALTVERLDDGEVSPYLVDELRGGDELELRGPIGGYFVWRDSDGGPLQLLAGGSGVVPLRAMLRHREASGSSTPARLLYSTRSLDDVIYRDELMAQPDGVEVTFALTRSWPDDWAGHRGRIDATALGEAVWAPHERPLVYVCGPTGFVEAAANALVELGHEPGRIKAERFGASGT
jgi:ferredoxin-NADP reductase